MVTYLIEGSILFIPSESTLNRISSNETVLLPLLTCDVFLMLLLSQGEAISRDKLLTDIFERREASPTNHNLNQYVLNLRKQLVFLGLENPVIQTVPRVGFMIPSGVLVEKREHEQRSGSYEKLLKDKNTFTETHIAPPTKRGGLSVVRLSQGLLSAWILLMLLITSLLLKYQSQNASTAIHWDDPPYANPVALNDDKMCQIFIIPSGIDIHKDNAEKYKSLIHKFVPVQCTTNEMTRYYIYRSAESATKFRTFVLRCSYHNNDRPYCYSWYRESKKKV